jgi:hypothetical protein
VAPNSKGLLDVPRLVAEAHVHSHERVQMLGVFAPDDSGVWLEQWRAWIDPERPAEPTIAA